MSLTIDKRGVIRFGDTTSHGGRVIRVASVARIEGRRIARIGDLVICPLCKAVFPIIEGEPTCLDDGIPVALDGHKTACGASLITSVTKS